MHPLPLYESGYNTAHNGAGISPEKCMNHGQNGAYWSQYRSSPVGIVFAVTWFVGRIIFASVYNKNMLQAFKYVCKE